jgi:hypothetical protein
MNSHNDRATANGDESWFELHEQLDSLGGLRLELLVEGESISTASIDAAARADLRSALGLEEASVRALLKDALLREAERELAKVRLAPPRQLAGPNGARLASAYTLEGSTSLGGLVWYDVTAQSTGPDSAPAIARSKIRTMAARQLALAHRGFFGFLWDVLDHASA